MWLTQGVDLQTAADRLGVHYQTAYRWVRDGSLVAVKRGSIYDVDEAALADFAARRSAPTPPPQRATVRDWGRQVDRLYALLDRKSTRLNSSHANISYAVFCLKKKQ